MTRHGKNCTAGAVYTYHENKKDTAASGYGTQKMRLSRDAIKDFDCCCLSLQPCRDPVLPSFWIPSMAPKAKAARLEKPSRVVRCPMSGKPLLLSDLAPVRFTPVDGPEDRVGPIARRERYVCAVTRDGLNNTTPCAVLRRRSAWSG
uniref:Nitric oxide synthase-interacting protein zinc-finger domain-containing protein n=1 Tax=Vombatus ursinus TaxID=29139 RepID=A0A4X2LIY5_VOMUR